MTFDEELREILGERIASGEIWSLGDSSPLFAQLAQAFPSLGSQMDWWRVPRAIVRTAASRATEAVEYDEFVAETCDVHSLTGPTIYMGDSATDIAWRGDMNGFRRSLPQIIAIPQHHYFCDATFAWCLSLTFEGDIAFGFGPSDR